jgi:hypothetical protein
MSALAGHCRGLQLERAACCRWMRASPSTPRHSGLLLLLRLLAAQGRVLDFLLELPSAAERAGSLSDCFTPPPGGSGEEGEGEGEELLWCTPRQLLAEVERRLQPSTSHAARQQQQQQPGALQPLQLQGPGLLQPHELAAALQHLKAEITEHWLYSFPAGMQQR